MVRGVLGGEGSCRPQARVFGQPRGRKRKTPCLEATQSPRPQTSHAQPAAMQTGRRRLRSETRKEGERKQPWIEGGTNEEDTRAGSPAWKCARPVCVCSTATLEPGPGVAAQQQGPPSAGCAGRAGKQAGKQAPVSGACTALQLSTTRPG